MIYCMLDYNLFCGQMILEILLLISLVLLCSKIYHVI